MSLQDHEDLGVCEMCERAPATVQRRTSNLEAAFCAECDRDPHGAYLRQAERRSWNEGSWTEEGKPILPKKLPEFVWLWIESKHQEHNLNVMSGPSMQTLLLAVHPSARNQLGRNPRWFWRRIAPVKPPEFP